MQAAPAILIRLAYTGLLRILYDIPRDRQKIARCLHIFHPVKPLKQMAHAVVLLIKILRIYGIEPLHELRYVFARIPHQYMDVICHQAISADRNPQLFRVLPNQLDVILIVHLIFINNHLSHASRDHVSEPITIIKFLQNPLLPFHISE